MTGLRALGNILASAAHLAWVLLLMTLAIAGPGLLVFFALWLVTGKAELAQGIGYLVSMVWLIVLVSGSKYVRRGKPPWWS